MRNVTLQMFVALTLKILAHALKAGLFLGFLVCLLSVPQLRLMIIMAGVTRNNLMRTLEFKEHIRTCMSNGLGES